MLLNEIFLGAEKWKNLLTASEPASPRHLIWYPNSQMRWL